MNYIYIALLSITLVPHHLSSQTIDVDSIKQLYSLAKKSYHTNPEQSLGILTSVIENSIEADYKNGLYAGYYLKGYIYLELGILDLALINHYHAWETSLQINDQKKIIKSLKAIGKIYFMLGHYGSAQVYYSDALAYSVKEADTMNIANFNKMMGMCNRKLHQADSALHYYHRAIDYYYSIDKMYQVASVNNLVGILYLQELEDYEQSREYYFKAKKINREHGNEISLEGDILNNIGYSYFKEKDMVKAEEYYLQVVTLNPENKELKYYKVVYNNMGGLKLLSNNIKEAENYFIKSEQANNSPILEIERHYSYENLFKIYSTTNRSSEYMPYTRKLLAQSKELIILKKLLDRILEQYLLKTVDYQRQLAKERFEREIESQVLINIIVSLSLLIVLVVVFFTTKRFFFYRDKWRKIKDKYNHFTTIYNDLIKKYKDTIAAQLKLNQELGIVANTEIRDPREYLWKNFDDEEDGNKDK